MKPTSRSDGVQAVFRSTDILRAVAASQSDGARVTDIARVTGLDRSTCHRLMRTLVDAGLLEQDPTSRLYFLGLDFFTLASAASNRHDVQEMAQSVLSKVAELTGDAVFFSLRSGFDAVCVDVRTGSYPIQTLPLDIGSRFPVGAGVTGAAFLTELPDENVEAVLSHNRDKLKKVTGQNTAWIREQLDCYRSDGYLAADEPSTPGIATICVPLFNRRGRAIAALSVAAIKERSDETRRREIAKILHQSAEEVVDAMLRMPDTRRHRHSWAGINGKH